MKNNKKFNSRFSAVGSFASFISNESIKDEPMFFNSDLSFAYDNGGPITRSFLMKLPQDWESNVVFDSRVHMLMPGWYPAIPGYHHDDVPRNGTKNGQPNYDNPAYLSEHIIGLVNADVCPTHFAVGEAEFNAVPEGDLVYRQWHKEVMDHIKAGNLVKCEAADRTLLKFDWQTWHTGTQAVANGWRWFGRVSRKTDRVKSITNEIRVNAQVYLEFPLEGW